MTISFSAIISHMITEKLNTRIGYLLSMPIMLLGGYSVITWYLSELEGSGDMRLYIAFQVCSILTIPLVLLTTPDRYTHSWLYLVTCALYGIAKLAEHLDTEIYHMTNHIVSGHTLKHLIAGLAMYGAVYMVKRRRHL
eukprot:TRINITY_DN5969_c0_g1_i1.p1 TRINITY_DN5969_c0_g1~~TRINITY_DN5969_c0_g1_i1.p1  ORF type:complete len:138 (-),score=8.69 TRINITY_DN5969_c0_g1_i1:30-443(-)